MLVTTHKIALISSESIKGSTIKFEVVNKILKNYKSTKIVKKNLEDNCGAKICEEILKEINKTVIHFHDFLHGILL